MPYTRPEQVVQYVVDLLNNNKVSLGLSKVTFGDATLILDYPAAVVVADPLERELHGTQQFRNWFRLAIFVYHAQMTVDRDTRTKEDLQLVTGIVNLLHNPTHRTLGGNIVFGHVDSEAPGTISRPGNVLVIGSRITWLGQERQAFPSS